MNDKALEELRQKYIDNPPEGMTARLVRDMTDSDLLDMHYFLTEEDDFDDDEHPFLPPTGGADAERTRRPVRGQRVRHQEL